MKVTNHVRMVLPAEVGNEGFARAAVAAFCAPLCPTVEQINDIKTAVSEAVTNAIVHAYPEKKGEITVEVVIYDDKMVSIRVSDEGIGMANVDEARKPFYTTKSANEHSGMGFTIMEAFMDAIDVASELGGGTILTMRKNLKENA
ncbi:MAG: anti-sigma F factor [Clostridia bacterium]|nr:anti-sigma F factor [Clostridia bacterium]